MLKMQAMTKWLKHYHILESLTTVQLVEICRNLRLFECPMGTKVIVQGTPGDSFYIVLGGSLDVYINSINVNNMVIGSSFGEKALENDAPRSATVIASCPCLLMVLLASEYKRLAFAAQVPNLHHSLNLLIIILSFNA